MIKKEIQHIKNLKIKKRTNEIKNKKTNALTTHFFNLFLVIRIKFIKLNIY
jgi:hypothetical protein